ncbi:hypothetical protein AX17_004135, partial [Amanita inopinata Kibby_2008]
RYEPRTLQAWEISIKAVLIPPWQTSQCLVHPDFEYTSQVLRSQVEHKLNQNAFCNHLHYCLPPCQRCHCCSAAAKPIYFKDPSRRQSREPPTWRLWRYEVR